jgi:hypothetical protein
MSGPDVDDETATKDIQRTPLVVDTFSATSPTATVSPSAAPDHTSVQVAVRVRPLLAQEAGSDRCLQVLHQHTHHATTLQLGGSSGPRFTFDQVFDSPAHQNEVFEQRVVSLVQSCLEGYNATVLAYGQTGSGKTFTMMGTDDPTSNVAHSNAGVIPRSLVSMFQSLEEQNERYEVRLQFLEVYGEDIRDLLGHNDKLTVRDVGGAQEEPEVVGATQRPVATAQDALRALGQGMLRRVTGSTAMNASSSRSHAILSVMVEQEQHLPQEGVIIKRSKFNFVDLAGSERLKRTQAEGQRMREGIDINKGLLVLGNVISALGDPKKRGKAFVPYRDSKLTRLLKGSLGGNHKTLMIACVSPSDQNMEESMNCLRYANRAKNIQNNAVVNVDAHSRVLAELQGNVQILSTTLLQALDGKDILAEGPFTREALESMAGGVSNSTPVSTARRSADTPVAGVKTAAELEMEVTRLREKLRQSQTNHDEAEEQLYAAKAQKQLYELQLSVSSEDGGISNSQANSFFLQKATAYEKEIGRLRQSLRDADAKSNSRMNWANQSSNISDAESNLNSDRQRLNMLQKRVDQDSNSNLASTSHSGLLEMDADEEEVHQLTQKYLAHSGHVDDEEDVDDGEDEEDVSHYDEEDGENRSSSSTNVDDLDSKKKQDLQVNLIELSRSIAAKEDLIDQLKFSEEKFAVREIWCANGQYLSNPDPSHDAFLFTEHAGVLRRESEADGRSAEGERGGAGRTIATTRASQNRRFSEQTVAGTLTRKGGAYCKSPEATPTTC